MFYLLKRWFLGAILLSALLGLSGCGSDGKDGEDADPAVIDDLQTQIDDLSVGDKLADVRPEQCVLCHDDSGSLAKSGAQHQADYEEFYQDQVLRVINLAYAYVGTDHVVTFDMAKKDEFGIYQPFDCRLATTNPEPNLTDALMIMFAEYDPATRTFSDGASSAFWREITGDLTYDGSGGCTSTFADTATLGDLDLRNGHIVVYGRDETLIEDPARHIDSPKFPFAAMIKTGTGTDYVSVANSSGCENCHTVPFLKHTFIYGEVSDSDLLDAVDPLGDPGNEGNDFYVCKTCHLDEFSGFGSMWTPQILTDLEHLLAEAEEAGDTDAADLYKARIGEIVDGGALTAEEQTKYAYTTRLMNNVHISHAMEFGFPQSMRNCVTCHGNMGAGEDDKLDEALATENFLPETCISCHAIDGLKAKMTTNRAGNAVTVHNNFITAADASDLKATACNSCHSSTTDINPATGLAYSNAGIGPVFSNLHSGYDPEIYSDDGTKYSEVLTVSVDSASFDAATNVLTVGFSAAENPADALADYDTTDIVPMIIVGPYGYDTKHYIVYPHGRDENRERLLEYEIGSGAHPRIAETANSVPGDWEVTVDLSMWADMIADGAIKRLEIGVMPELGHATLTTLDRRGNEVPLVLAMDAPSRTFDITAPSGGAFLNDYPDVADGVEDDIVDVAGGCNSCHDALATTFHSANRGGNIKICKMCHVPSAAGSHLEMQSRSIDSYVHAVHSFQLFDIGDIDISDPVEAAEHDHKLKAEFPRFGVKNCESCHVEGKYGVPNQAQSLPSLHAGSDDAQFDRNITDVPRYVMGPAARACGACHRAQALNADDADKLNAFNDHVKTFGYLVEDGDGVWEAVVDKIMAIFN